MVWRSGFQSLVEALYPATCLSCEARIEGAAGLCSRCWISSHFIAGLVCNACGTPLTGASNELETCDECIETPRIWSAARAVFLYEEHARKLVWELKYADRPEVARAAGGWLWQALKPILPENPLVTAVPLHWTRLLKRKYNQSELLALALCSEAGIKHVPNLLRRVKRTPQLVGLDRDERQRWLNGAITAPTKRRPIISGRHIVLVDDVMTTGATLTAATQALQTANAASVTALCLARAAKRD